jgi:hypothetical protein
MFPDDREYITYRRQRGIDNIFHSKLEEEKNMGNKNELPMDSTLNILNDLARGQQQLVKLL